jgi:hypothetical protein
MRQSLKLAQAGRPFELYCRDSEKVTAAGFGVVIGASIAVALATYELEPLEKLKLMLLGDAIRVDTLASATEALQSLAALEAPAVDDPPLARMLAVCRAVLEGAPDAGGIAYSRERQFKFKNIEKLWESGVCVLLEAAARQVGGALTVRAHPLSGSRVRLVEPSGPELDPDASISMAEETVAISDAKYKIASAPLAPDVYQLFAYTTRINARLGLLVYVSSGDAWTTFLGHLDSGAKLFAVGVSVGDVARGDAPVLTELVRSFGPNVGAVERVSERESN